MEMKNQSFGQVKIDAGVLVKIVKKTIMNQGERNKKQTILETKRKDKEVGKRLH